MTETRIRLFKILLLGDADVGKTTFLHRYIEDSYNPANHVTIGVDFKITYVEIEPGVRVKLQIWDTGGQWRYRTIVRSYLRSTDGFLLVFDLTNHRSFENIKNDWFPLVPESAQSSPCVLVGLKSELKNRRVSREEAEELAKELGASYVEASSPTGHNVKKAFETLVQMIYKNIPNAKFKKFALES